MNTAERLSLVQSTLFQVADEFGWMLQAWAVLSNHYHLIALSPEDPKTLSRMLSKLHTLTAKTINQEDDSPGRQVWFQYWDSHITFQTSYYARLNYVHNNPVHHGVSGDATNYRWCSAAWFAENAKPSFVHTIDRFKTDSINLNDDFKVIPVKEGIR